MLLHLLVVLLVVVMVNLGFWQLRRLHERRHDNDLVRSRSTEQPVPVESVVSPSASGDDLDAVRFRAVSATGTYDAAATGLVTGRTQGGAPGGYVVTPVHMGDAVVLVVRGFARLGPDGQVPVVAPPATAASVTGYALPISGFDAIARHDLEAMASAAGSGVLPAVVDLSSSSPSDDPRLAPVPLPPLDEGPHLSYAIQWFLFSTIALVGYPLALRRAAGRVGST